MTRNRFGLRTYEEHGNQVVVLPLAVIRLSWPLFKRSPRHRGRILRARRQGRQIVLRTYHGLF